jgi:hypothetical protein
MDEGAGSLDPAPFLSQIGMVNLDPLSRGVLDPQGCRAKAMW